MNMANLFPFLFFLLQLHKQLLSVIVFEVEAPLPKLKHSDRLATEVWASTEHKAASTFHTP